MDKKKKRNNDILARGQLNLQANQQGYITAQQKDWVRQDMRAEYQHQLRLVYASGVVFLIVTVILALMPYLPIPIISAPIVWLICVIAWYVYFQREHKPIRDDLEAGKVQSVTGYADKSIKLGYHVSVKGVDYATPPDMYLAFEDTQRYTIYFTPVSKIVLSAEVIEDDMDDNIEVDDDHFRYLDDDLKFRSDHQEL